MAEPTTESSLSGRRSWQDNLRDMSWADRLRTGGKWAIASMFPVTGAAAATAAFMNPNSDASEMINPFEGFNMLSSDGTQPTAGGQTGGTGPVSGAAQGIVDSIWPKSGPRYPAPEYPTIPLPPQQQAVETATDAGNDAYQQYLDQRTDAWRLQQDQINDQYGTALDPLNEQLKDLESRYGYSTDAYNDYQQGLGAIDTDVPYGAIADLDTSRVSKQFDEAEGRLAQALNVMPDDLSNQTVNEVRYFEDVTETMLSDDIENIDKLHELSGVYAQAIADSAYSTATLEGQRAKLEMQAQFDREIYKQKRAIEKTKLQQKKAIENGAKQFQLTYPEFELNRETVTEQSFMKWATEDGGYSFEDAQQAWQGYQNMWDKYSGEIATQGDFDRLYKQEINSQNISLLSPQVAADLTSMWGWDPDAFDLTDPESQQAKLEYTNAMILKNWLSRHDMAQLFNESEPGTVNPAIGELVGMLRRSGFTTDQVNEFIERGVDAAAADSLFSYSTPEAKATRQAYQMTNEVDDSWERIYYDSMTIPVDSQYVHQDPTTKAVFPVAGPGIAFDDVGMAKAQQGTPIVAPLSGKVVETGYDRLNGHYVVIQMDNGDKVQFSNMEEPSVMNQGARVQAGTSVGRIGNSGAQSTHDYGLHVTYWHDGVQEDPRKLFGSYGSAA